MGSFIELKLKSDILTRLGLPDRPYPIPDGWLEAMVQADGELPLGLLLAGAQLRAAQPGDWRDQEATLDRLAELVAPEDDRPVVVAEGETWWLELGPVDMDQTLVTIQRDDELIAAIQLRDDGRLRVATYRPLDARSAEWLINLAQPPRDDEDAPSNWGYGVHAAGGMGQFYASREGRSYLSYWEKGLGRTQDGDPLEPWYSIRGLKARRPALSATEIGAHYAFSEPPEAPSSAPATRKIGYTCRCGAEVEVMAIVESYGFAAICPVCGMMAAVEQDRPDLRYPD